MSFPKVSDLPILSRPHLEALESIFPPRCKDRAETEEDHQRYAGKVELVTYLRARFEQAKESNAPEQDTELDPMLDGEKAT